MDRKLKIHMFYEIQNFNTANFIDILQQKSKNYEKFTL